MINFQLLIKKIRGLLASDEEQKFKQWLQEDPEHEVYFERRKEIYNRADEDLAWNQVHQLISPPEKKLRHRYWSYGVAAGVVVLLGIAGVWYADQRKSDLEEDIIFAGSSKAILTLEDGSQVPLAEGNEYNSNHAHSNGSQIVYTSEAPTDGAIPYNELSVPRGGEYFLQLADGTKVWLNNETKIKYPEKFAKGLPRQVELVYGEAYFEVSPAAKYGGSTFHVITKDQEIEVLGTQFNISAFQDTEHITTTLVEGAIAITNESIREKLAPGDQAIVTPGKPIAIHQVSPFSYTAWKKGLFAFRSTPLRDVMKDLARWYDIDVIYKTEKSPKTRFSGVVDRNQSIDEVLSMISSSIQFRKQGKTVIIE
ncbi:FecR family protein [Sinomicrobium soli]|uniref:FecR family protein n=1 Tax=Sinomicrobium sp. N-1-3-6 TaxID=2219864 RepID=UPI000DCF4810|nr:FecR family protein [Sinomicrobium sp. N-1-3-6]RAV29190.1 hypothetical protein DN748_09735 [Sinomicrobium sp. N-1-3-6]